MRYRLKIITIGSQLGLEDALNKELVCEPIIQSCGELTKFDFGSGQLYVRSNIINTITVTEIQE